MCAYRNSKEWWRAYDFMNEGLPRDLFVGYEATARMSELVGSYPQMLEWRKSGKYREIRFKFEEVDKFYHSLPDEFKEVLRYYKVNNTLF